MMSKIEKRALRVMAKHGFSFHGDPIFRNAAQATKVLNKLCREGLAYRSEEDGGILFRLTPDGEATVKYMPAD